MKRVWFSAPNSAWFPGHSGGVVRPQGGLSLPGEGEPHLRLEAGTQVPPSCQPLDGTVQIPGYRWVDRKAE